MSAKPMAGCGPYLMVRGDLDVVASMSARSVRYIDGAEDQFSLAISNVRSGRISRELRRETQEALKGFPRGEVDAS